MPGVSLTTDDTALEPWAGSSRLRLAGAAVHLYTASGTVLALLVVIAALNGNAVQALWLSLVALVIDGTDGMLARRFRVSESIPWFDGARLDDIVDYLTYVFAPVLLLWTGNYLPAGTVGAALAGLPLLASSYQFCRVDAKTEDHFFLGFPSYWNVLAFYVVVLALPPGPTGVLLAVCSILVFVPLRYIYPSRTRAFRRLSLVLTAGWLATYALLLLEMPVPNRVVIALSLLYLVYYLGLSVFLSVTGAAPRPKRATARPERPVSAAAGPHR